MYLFLSDAVAREKITVPSERSEDKPKINMQFLKILNVFMVSYSVINDTASLKKK